MLEAISFLGLGLVLGVAAGITPGPLMALIFSETLQHGSKAGIRIAVAPIFTDIPVVFASLFIVSKFSKVNFILGTISILGGIIISYYAYENLFKKINVNLKKSEPKSLGKGVIINFFNPHLYVNSITIHAPIMLKALQSNIFTMMLYFLGFMLALVASKIAMALVIGKSKKFIESRVYIYTIRILGVVLVFFAILFLREGLKYLGVI